MEIFLLIIIIALLFFKLNALSDKLELLQSDINNLKKSITKLISQNPQITISKPAIKPNDLVPEIKTPDPTIQVKIEPKIDKPIVSIDTAPIAHKPIELKEIIAPKKSYWEKFREQNPDLEKFVGENLINKTGILILVLGISYFVRFAIDKNWINETARVGIGVLCGAILMIFAHKLRENYKAFSSVIVAGSISVLYFTIAIAFHQYQIFSHSITFVLMVLITAFSVLVSVSYDRMELAILSLIGGFAVPFMLSTGQGNHVVLFSYIAILDLGVLAIAYKKKWSLVNVLVFFFTAILYGGWLATKVVYQPEAPYLSAFLFATLFYLIFMLINIVNNLRTNGLFSKIELSVLISNTFLYFSAGMIIVSNSNLELKGLFTISLAAFNLISAWLLYKKFGLDKNAIFILIGLTLTFITLAIPLQFKGNYITLFWSAEAVLLLWLSQKSKIIQFRFTSVILHVLMIISLVLDWIDIYSPNAEIASLFLNKGFITGVFLASSLVLYGRLTKNETEKHTLFNITLDSNQYRDIVMIFSTFLFYITGLIEAIYQSNQFYSGSFSPSSISVAYHLLFSSTLIFFIEKKQNFIQKIFVIGFSFLNIIFYVIYFSTIPFGEIQNNFASSSINNIAFYMHYISLCCVIYMIYVLLRNTETIGSIFQHTNKWFFWFIAFVIVFASSQEVLLHIIKIFITQDGSNYENIYTSTIKVAFPILWGLLAFLFLVIGIKKQNKNLRIISLVLLTLTIAKLFVYDISNASETGKIIAFILLGITILIMSFTYQKIKKIVLKNKQ